MTSRTNSKRMELDPSLYTVAWIAPLEIEARAALHMLDNRHHGRFPWSYGYDYLFHAGDINRHNVIIATLPVGQEYGTGSAAALASQIKTFFPNMRFGLLVGVAAGLPNLSRSPPRDIRLGDVLVGLPDGESAGLVAYDLGKETTEGFQLLRCGHVLAKTETIIRSAISSIKIESPDDTELFLPFYEKMRNKRHATGTFIDPGQDRDKLYAVGEDGVERLVKRDRRPDTERVRVWYGPIGSGDKLMKNASKRNELRDRYDVIGLEMEAAGTMNQIPVGVIRGVCDYGDEHKNKAWQPYAAAMAAAYAKAVLYQILPKRRTPIRPISSSPLFERDAIMTGPQDVVQVQQQLVYLQQQVKMLESEVRRCRLPPQIKLTDLVVLNDGLGETYCFSLTFIDSMELFVEILKYKFRDVGSQKIERKEWILQDHHTGHVLDLTKPWRKVVKSGQVLDMSMIFRKRGTSKGLCPWCHSENTGNTDERIECCVCHRTFHRVEEINEIEVRESSPVTSLHRQNNTEEQTSQTPSPRPKPLKRPDDGEDINLYTRVQIIETYFYEKRTGQAKTAARQIMLRPRDLADRDCLAEYLTKQIHGLSEEECLSALGELFNTPAVQNMRIGNGDVILDEVEGTKHKTRALETGILHEAATLLAEADSIADGLYSTPVEPRRDTTAATGSVANYASLRHHPRAGASRSTDASNQKVAQEPTEDVLRMLKRSVQEERLEIRRKRLELEAERQEEKISPKERKKSPTPVVKVWQQWWPGSSFTRSEQFTTKEQQPTQKEEQPTKKEDDVPARRTVRPGLPRPVTFKRQNSERRTRLLPAELENKENTFFLYETSNRYDEHDTSSFSSSGKGRHRQNSL